MGKRWLLALTLSSDAPPGVDLSDLARPRMVPSLDRTVGGLVWPNRSTVRPLYITGSSPHCTARARGPRINHSVE